MRLLNTRTLRFKDFFDNKIPKYAILSHRWVEDQEVTFQDWQTGTQKDGAGLRKIKRCCARAIKDSLDWVWIDTCCIDKSSSAELSEAINSMFRWYKKAEVCYAYLADVHEIEARADGAYLDILKVKSLGQVTASLLSESDWFNRGWTLQELLAPEKMLFFQDDWTQLGTKASLSARLANITGVSTEHLQKHESASVAVKMSWASRRTTSRSEDIAYCLLGLFDVNMPLLYGEGEKAFLRLQLEILKSSNDESIFAWTATNVRESSMLASEPKYFAKSGDVICHEVSPRPPYWMTNKGLELPVPTAFLSLAIKNSPIVPRTNFDGSISLMLHCRRKDEERNVGIRLRKPVKVQNHWVRIECETLSPAKSGRKARSAPGFPAMVKIYVRHHQPHIEPSAHQMA